KTSVSADTRKFLSTSAKRGNEVSCTEDIPRSFIVTFDKEKLDEKICISRISPALKP
ncbi:transposase, partial [Ruminococcus albus SY3]